MPRIRFLESIWGPQMEADAAEGEAAALASAHGFRDTDAADIAADVAAASQPPPPPPANEAANQAAAGYSDSSAADQAPAQDSASAAANETPASEPQAGEAVLASDAVQLPASAGVAPPESMAPLAGQAEAGDARSPAEQPGHPGSPPREPLDAASGAGGCSALSITAGVDGTAPLDPPPQPVGDHGAAGESARPDSEAASPVATAGRTAADTSAAPAHLDAALASSAAPALTGESDESPPPAVAAEQADEAALNVAARPADLGHADGGPAEDMADTLAPNRKASNVAEPPSSEASRKMD